MLTLETLSTESQQNPIGMDESLPCFGWRLASDKTGVEQTAYRILVELRGETVWDSGHVLSGQSQFVRYAGNALKPFSRYVWQVTVEDNHGWVAKAEAYFETGRQGLPWLGQWITAGGELDDDATTPPYRFRKSFSLYRDVSRAWISVTALGVYALKLSGNPVGADFFTPGYTDYLSHVQYQVYDVSDLIRAGENLLECELAGGWYAGRVGLSLKRNSYGKKRALLMELHIVYADGTSETIATDTSFQYTTDGPRRFADFFDGEVYDANKEDVTSWRFSPAELLKCKPPRIVPELGARTIRQECLKPLETRVVNGRILIDFGRNIAGIVLLKIDAPKNACITLSHAEILNAAGDDLYTENLRTAKAQIVYLSAGGEQSYEPRFTYMGFRYVKIEGIDLPQIRAIEAHALYANCPKVGSFQCDNALLNQLQENIITTQQANFIDIPTDCPQRDERVGWTGDLAIYSRTAAFNMNVGQFMRKWLRDLRSEQKRAHGNVPFVVPTGNIRWMRFVPSPIWGDACAIVPWDAYQATGDIRLLAESYESMKCWIRLLKRRTAIGKLPFSKGRYVYNGFSFGDWVAPDTTMQQQVARGKWIATAYFANTVQITAKTARLLGKTDEAETFERLYERIRQSYRAKLLDPSGHIKNGFQAAYATALYYDILPEEAAHLAADDLEKDVIAHFDHLTTGFPSTAQLPFALLDNGKTETAFRLLLQESCPSWLYPVKHGATSIWERWDALREDGSVNVDPVGKTNMVSFSHYAYGAVGQFLYERIGGLTADEPGYRRFTIAPKIGGDIRQARVTFHSSYGTIVSDWSIKEHAFMLLIEVPHNTNASVCMPDGSRYEVGSGVHNFRCALL